MIYVNDIVTLPKIKDSSFHLQHLSVFTLQEKDDS